jgi:bacterioferritin
MTKENIIVQLQKRMSEEWLAYYQYWVGALVCVGQLRPDIQDELNAHADEEKGHADTIANRIIELGGVPVLDPKEWFTLANSKYMAPKIPYNTIDIVEQNKMGEQQAIDNYIALSKALKDGEDQVTYLMIMEILGDEQRHKNDLLMYQKDFGLIK